MKKPFRRLERIFAFKVLYSVCFVPVRTLSDLERIAATLPDQPALSEMDFAWSRISGAWIHQNRIDQIIADLSKNWRIDRMAKVELTILRLALFELLYKTDTPERVAINEAIELSKQFGDDKSRSFVNGILDATLKALECGRLAREEAVLL